MDIWALEVMSQSDNQTTTADTHKDIIIKTLRGIIRTKTHTSKNRNHLKC